MKQGTKAKLLIGVFSLLTVLDLVFTRLGTPNLGMEANPLVQHFGMGWVSLLVSNLLVLGVYIFLVWYSFCYYQAPVCHAKGMGQYLDELDKHKISSPFLAAIGYAMAYSMIAGRLLPVIEWGVYLAGYVMPWYERLKKKIPFSRPDLWLVLICATVLTIRWYHLQYKENQRRLSELQWKGFAAVQAEQAALVDEPPEIEKAVNPSDNPSEDSAADSQDNKGEQHD